MALLISKFEFDKRARAMVGTAQAVVREALASKHFRDEVVSAAHRDMIGHQLLMVHRPDLVGVLASSETSAAIATALAALQELQTANPLLFETSRAPKSQVIAWARRAFPHRDADEIRASVSYMMAQDAWNLRYECQRRLADQSQDIAAIAAIAAEIERAFPGDQ